MVFEVIGVVTFNFTAPIKVVVKESTEKFNPTMLISKFSRFGELVVSFNETMIVPTNLKYINGTVLDIRVDPFNTDILALREPFVGSSELCKEQVDSLSQI